MCASPTARTQSTHSHHDPQLTHARAPHLLACVRVPPKAEVAKGVFGDMLYVESEHAEFPSPEALQGRILLRTAIANAPPLEPLIGVKKIRRKEMEAAMGEPGKVAAMPPVSVSYAEKIMDTMLTRPPTSMGSAELEARLSSFRRMSARHLVRVYPDGIRINSSNFCPWSMWFAGASLATLNWQVGLATLFWGWWWLFLVVCLGHTTVRAAGFLFFYFPASTERTSCATRVCKTGVGPRHNDQFGVLPGKRGVWVCAQTALDSRDTIGENQVAHAGSTSVCVSVGRIETKGKSASEDVCPRHSGVC